MSRDPALRLAPDMTVRDIVALEDLLLEQAALLARDGVLDVLEWGAGGSTVYFSDYLRSRPVPFSWVTVEHNPVWAERVRAMAGSEVRVALRDPTELELRDQEHWDFPLEDYIQYPHTLGRRFDLILVDGRRRRRCLLAARTLLAPRGVVVLHDSGRAHYHRAFASYETGRFVSGTSFWVGRSPLPEPASSPPL